jgi:hypothetical protein
MNMKLQTDHEILIDLIKQLSTTDNDENRKTILTDLEYYLHQVCLLDFRIHIEFILYFSMIMQYYLLI